ncbi:hypothetical protein [uncultured Paraglaciecola sp.]|jgi:hypothetical protein|uniref:hypothetical protein n=1 Tax=uncultured Paraglaciecola sp. TaxID=1765024 RepID=UPI002636AE8B|nr:hypothetical protein [uncultured Paraglaciecola sp.]
MFKNTLANGKGSKIMKSFKGMSSVVLAALMLGGCASAPVVEIKPFDKSVSFEGNYDESWSKLVGFMSTNDISIGTIEKDSGLVTLSGDDLSPELIAEYCDAKAPFLWVLTGGKGSGSVLMTEDSGFITATVNVKFQGTSTYTMANPPQYKTAKCNSRGAFESAVLGSLQ